MDMITVDIPTPQSYTRNVISDVNLREVWKYTRMTFFYQKILGYNRNIRIDLRRKEPKALKFVAHVKELEDQIISDDLMRPKAIYQYFPAVSSGNDTIVTSSTGEEIVFHFPRQSSEPYLCLSDYLQPEEDNMGFMIGTSGAEILQYAKKLESEGEFKDAFILQGIALSTAESLTEMIHHKMRQEWNLFEEEWDVSRGPPRKYRGQRYSFGYPACPNMSDQEKLFKLLSPSDIGIELTESNMMSPEASVSCIVFHHPDAKYFNV